MMPEEWMLQPTWVLVAGRKPPGPKKKLAEHKEGIRSFELGPDNCCRWE